MEKRAISTIEWLSRKLWAKPAVARDPIAALRQEPTSDEQWALRREWFENDKLDALREGTHELSGYSNVAMGRGYTLQLLLHDGLMRCEMQMGLPGDGGRYVYTVTAAGRRYLAEDTSGRT